MKEWQRGKQLLKAMYKKGQTETGGIITKKLFCILLICIILLINPAAMCSAGNGNDSGHWQLQKTETNKDESLTEDIIRSNENIIAYSYDIHPGGGSMSTTFKDGEGSVTISSSHTFSVPETLVPGDKATIQISASDAGSSNSNFYISHSTEATIWVNNGSWRTLTDPLTAATDIFVIAENPDASIKKAEKTFDFTVPQKAEGFTVHFKILGGSAPGPMVINYDYVYVENVAALSRSEDTEPIKPDVAEPSSGTAEDTAALPSTSVRSMTIDDYDNYIDYLDDAGLLEYTDQDAGCVFSDLGGQVEVFVVDKDDPEGGYWEFAKMDTALKPGMRVRTGLDSSAVLSFADMSSFVLKPNTTIVLDTPSRKENKLILAAGNIWANVKHMVKYGSMDVEMSQAVAGIKGTIFVCEDDGQTSTLKVIEGSVLFTDRSTGTKTTVSGGEMISAGANGTPVIQFNIKQEHADWKTYAQDLEITNNKIAALFVIPGICAGVAVVLVIILLMLSTKRKRAPADHSVPETYRQEQQPAQPGTGTINCSGCGHQITARALFCPNCGSAVSPINWTGQQNLVGFSNKISDTAFSKYKRDSNSWSAIFALILAVIAVIAFPIYGKASGELEWPVSLYYGAGIGGMFVVIAVIQIIRRSLDKTWDGEVVYKDYYRQRERNSNGQTHTHIIYVLKIRKDSGRVRKHKWRDMPGPFDYYNVGDRIRHHKGFYYYEKYDKSMDSEIMCAACNTFNDIRQDICKRCKCPLLK